MIRRFITGFAGGLCLVVGWQTIPAGYKILGWTVWIIGCVNLWILVNELRKK